MKSLRLQFFVIRFPKLKITLTALKDLKIIKPLICYAVKANSNKHILSFLAKKGSGADVVSEGELKKSIDNGIMLVKK